MSKIKDMDRYYQILEYEMTQNEAKSFKLALIWEELARESFPNESCGKLPIRGDPRKSSLFKYCHKLLRETKGLILDDQYRWYIKSQFDVLRNLKNEGIHANVSPSCLVGEKAWRRWKVWLSKFNSISKVGRADIMVLDSKIVAKLNKTKEFLIKQFKREPSFDDIKQAFLNRTILRWVTVGKICGYYIILSPFIEKCLNGEKFEDHFVYDLNIYRSHINLAIEEYFKKEFSYEYIK
jgi:hypothetical protein